jgi:hypothetical protein
MMKFQCALQVYCIMSIECSRQWPMSRRCVLTQLNGFLLSTSKPFRFSLAEYVYDEIAMILRSAPFVHLTLPARKSGVTQRPWRSRRELRSFIRRPSFPIAPCICSFPKYRYVFLSNSSCREANVRTRQTANQTANPKRYETPQSMTLQCYAHCALTFKESSSFSGTNFDDQ